MTRLLFAALLVLAACDKPTPESCRKALINMQHILAPTAAQNDEAQLASQVRACRGGSSKASVECATKATNKDELKKCDFYKNAPDEPPAGSDSGSAGSAK